jgi:uncharacterized protein with ATP-grasp and redox domains
MAAPEEKDLHLAVLRDWAGAIAGLDEQGLAQPPTALACELYPKAYKLLGVEDPYREKKALANARVLERLPELEKEVRSSENPLRVALNLAIHGNFIDLGAPGQFDWEHELDVEELRSWSVEAHGEFEDKVAQGGRALVFGDNAGEIALDRLLVQLLRERGLEVDYVVRGVPIINDATREDARAVGLDKLCRILDTGAGAPGVLLDRAGPELRLALAEADLVLSKGQGNFESLHGRLPGAFYAFKAKCEVVTKLLGVELGASMFVREEGV